MEMLIDAGRALALLIAANGTPVIAAKLARDAGAAPLDFGWIMPDGERLFGSHKTWRGLICGVLGCALAAAVLGLPPALGAGFGAVSLVADALSSAVKRRMRLEPGTETLGLDQLGEALLPLVSFAQPLVLNVVEVLVVTLSFVIIDVATVRLRHRRWLS